MIAHSPASALSSPEGPLEIAFLVPEDRQTGTYFRFHNLAVALGQLGHRVQVYSQTNAERVRTTRAVRDGVPYTFTPSVPGNSLVIAPVNPGNFVRRLFAPVAPADVYHLFQPYPSAAIPWLTLRERRTGVFAYDWDDFWINDDFGLKHPRGLNSRWTSFMLRFFEQHLPRACDLLTTLSHALASLGHRWRCPRTEMVYNGVWASPVIARAEARRALGLREDAFYVGTMGWSGEIRWAFEGLRACLATHPHVRMACCGKDPTESLQDFPEVRDHVDVLGYLPDEKINAFRCALDLGLIPMAATEFNFYRLPYKLTDFLASGTPVLVSAIGETTVLAQRLRGIALCAPTRAAWIETFAHTLDAMAGGAQPQRVDGAELVAEFSWPRVAQRLAAAYRSVQAEKAASL